METWTFPPAFWPRGIVFDMDGLMIDTERIIKDSWEIMGEKLGYDHFGENITYTLGRSRQQRDAYFLKKYGDDFPLREFVDGYRKIYLDYQREHGIPQKEGLTELLEMLKKRNMPLAVATSTHGEHALKELKNQGLLPYFQTVVTGDMVSRGKPDPEIYQLACRKLQVDPSCALALEDSYSGIQSAAAAGMKVIMIPDLLEDHTPVAEHLFGKLKSLRHVADWLEESFKSL